MRRRAGCRVMAPGTAGLRRRRTNSLEERPTRWPGRASKADGFGEISCDAAGLSHSGRRACPPPDKDGSRSVSRLAGNANICQAYGQWRGCGFYWAFQLAIRQSASVLVSAIPHS